jgi:ABC-type sugar transport system ATPase subunit
MEGYILEAKKIVKTFPGVRALGGVNLSVRKGEVHAIVGENGAGKSTLIQVLGGVYTPDEGEIMLDSEKVTFETPRAANAKGISIVSQELSLVPILSVAENIFANRQPVKKFNMIDWKSLYKSTKEILSQFNIDFIDPGTPAKDLSIANQQIVEILKAISLNPKVLILDEPTSSLTDIEVKLLFNNIRKLKEKGMSFIYISHHLNEIFEIADTVTVLRDGEYICEANVCDIDEEYLVTNMVGRKVENIYGKKSDDSKIGDVIFQAKKLSLSGLFKDISFEVRAGEIVGFAGLIGAGRTEVASAIFGSIPAHKGEIWLKGEKITIRSPVDAIKAGIGYMTEDRKYNGLYLNFTLKSNFISNRLKAFCRKGFINEKQVDESARNNIKQFRVSTPSAEQLVRNLSGGNQQKVLLGTWLGIDPIFLIVDEPTKGVDVGAKNEIYLILRELARSGVAIMLISSDLQEILGMADRVLVMKEGLIVGELNNMVATEEKVIALATNVKINNQEGTGK